jgi:hypothetical protein
MLLTNLLLIVTICLLGSLLGFVLWLSIRGRRDYNYFRYLLERYSDGPYRYGPDRYDPYGPRVYRSPLLDLIEKAQRRHDVNLSWAAREMLIIPIAEQIEDGRSIEWEQVEASINKIVATMRESSLDSEMSRRGRHNAVAVIKAFYKRFCNIPPFCAPTEETPERST